MQPQNTATVCPKATRPLSRALTLAALRTLSLDTPATSEEPAHPVLNPTLRETLAAWTMLGEQVPLTVRAALQPFAANRPAGTTHVGYQRHHHNAGVLIKAGHLVQVGMSRYDQPEYKPAPVREEAEEVVELIVFAGGNQSFIPRVGSFPRFVASRRPRTAADDAPKCDLCRVEIMHRDHRQGRDIWFCRGCHHQISRTVAASPAAQEGAVN